MPDETLQDPQESGEDVVGEVPQIPSDDDGEQVPDTAEQETETKTVSFEEFQKMQAEMKDSLAKEQARRAYAERELKRKEREVKPAAKAETPRDSNQEPQEDQFENYNDYIRALTGWEASKRLEEYKRGEIERTQQQLKADREKKVDAIVASETAKDPDFLSKAYIPANMPAGIEELVVDSDQFVQLALHFGKDPGEAIRIVNLPPVLAAREIGRIEEKLKSNVAPRIETKAPAKTKTVSGKEPVSRKLEDLSTEEYIAERRKVLYPGQ